MSNEDDQAAAVIAVPFDMVGELECEGLAVPLPVFRGTGTDALVTVGVDSAALVTLLQAPDSIRALAACIRARCARASATIDISARQGHRRIHLTVDGDIDISVVADFLAAAFNDEHDRAPGQDTPAPT